MLVDFYFELRSALKKVDGVFFEDSWKHIEMTVLVNALDSNIGLRRSDGACARNFLDLGGYCFINELDHSISIDGTFIID